MTESYEAWLERVAPQDPLDPGVRRPGADALLRAMFDQKGPISREELALEGRKVEMQLARDAVNLFLHDLHATTDVRPNIEVRHDAKYGLIVSYNGGYTTPATHSIRNPEATRHLLDAQRRG